MASGSGTKDDPWVLTTPPGTSEYTMYRDDDADPPILVCRVGSTTLRYHARAVGGPARVAAGAGRLGGAGCHR